VKAVVAGGRQPIGQDGKGLPARPTDSAPHPDAFVLVIVSVAEASSVANDRVVPANGTSPRQEAQRDHPESALSSASGNAIKRITAGVKAAADRRCQSFDLRPAFTLPANQFRTKKEYCFPAVAARPLTYGIGRLFCVIRPSDGRPVSGNPHIVPFSTLAIPPWSY
jgi:hypothetical protein